MGNHIDLGAAAQLWAKTSGTPPGWHPLAHHLLDVGRTAEALLGQTYAAPWRAALATAAGWTEAEVVAHVPYLLALHDLGKAAPSFQQKSPERWAVVEAAGFRPRRDARGVVRRHATETFWAVETLLAPYGRKHRKAIRHALAAHHGTWLTGDPSAEIPLKCPEDWAQPWRAARERIVAALAAEFAVPAPPTGACAASALFAALLNGLAILADWLGSDETCFPPAGELPWADYCNIARERAANVVAQRRFAAGRPADPDVTMADLFPEISSPRPLQQACEPASLPEPDGPYLAILEAPTGEGKTEAALLLAARTGDRFFFALPTQATSNQMHSRVKEWLTSRGDVAPRLIHGLADLVAADDRPTSLEPDDDEHDETEVDAWFRGRKRAMLAPHGVGTVDQAMYSGLLVKHVGLRLLALAGKVIIIDEVHAYDLYMSTIIDRLLTWLAQLGSSVILLSATLPAARRAELLAAYGVTEAAAVSADYPLCTLATRQGEVAEQAVAASTLNHRTVALDLAPDNPEAVAAQLLAEVSDGGCAVWVVNTVRAAQTAYQALLAQRGDDGPEILLFHAQFQLGPRQTQELTVLDRFGPGTGARPPAILVATQVVEQSLDLDFDRMVSQLAPVDLLLQRIGRLHRHQRDHRPPRLATPRCTVLLPETGDQGPDFGGSGYVYEPTRLILSWLAVLGRSTITVPEEVRPLVEAVYGPAVAPAAVDLARLGLTPERWAELTERAATQAESQTSNAQLGLLGRPDRDVAQLFGSAVTRQPDEDEADREVVWSAATRFGPPSLRCILLAEDDPLLSALRAAERPEPQVETDLLRHSVSLSDRRFVDHAVGTLRPHPGWARSGVLRPYLWVPLVDGAYCWPGGRLRVDPTLGVMVEKE